MFFVLSKMLNFLTNPMVIVLGFFLVALFVKRPTLKQKSFLLGIGLLIFFSNGFIANEVMRLWEVEATPYADITKRYSWGVVLTGVTLNDKLPDDRVYFNHGADRAIHAVDLYKRGVISKILISGGIGRVLTTARPEADEMFKAMKLMGVPDSAMVIENHSRNTYESAINVKEFLNKSNSRDTVLLITSAFHMRRSSACFNRAGVPSELFSCDFYTHPTTFTPDEFLVPKAEAILTWQKLFKEWLGMLAYKLAGYI
jgi:uncharacterized SAM-binding protein YcdF (DUF218 family)